MNAFKIFEALPVDGGTMSNEKARERAALTPAAYQTAKSLLLRTGEIQTGRGRGGTLRRLAEVDFSQRAGAVAKESDLYQPFRDWLEAGGGHPSQPFWLCKIVGHGQGQRRSTGQWSRPDVVSLSVTNFDLLPEIDVEVRTFELKPYPQAKNLTGVYEASAHQRRAHYASLVLEWPLGGDIPVPVGVQEECSRLGVGLLVMWANDVESLLEPQRQTPKPLELNEFIRDILSDPNDQDRYLSVIGRGADIPERGE